ncbi:MAG: CHAT domain-containing tetratricopeptide repeat protein [Candidatus Eisenbacteria bacterium]
MRTYLIVVSIVISACSSVEAEEYPAWQKLLANAESLVSTGYLDSANVLVDEAMSRALTEYGAADTTVEVKYRREGVSERFHFRSYAEAESLYTKVASLKEKILGGDHPDVAEVLTDMAFLQKQLGNYEEARSVDEQVLAVRKRNLGPEHLEVGRSLHGLGEACLGLSDYDGAEQLYRQSLSIFEKTLGPEHPEVALSLSGLGELHYYRGDYNLAKPLLERALAIREKTLTPEHPDVTTSTEILAVLYYTLGMYGDAEPLFKRVNGIRETALGPEHPDVATGLGNLGSLYEEQGRHADAEPLYKRALEITEKAYGVGHPDVAWCLHNLAGLYATLGRYADAEPLYERAFETFEKAFGPEHPDVATCLNNLAVLYERQGRYADAEPVHKRVLEIREETLGPEHPHVASSLSNLAGVYLSQGRYTDAEPLQKRALSIWEKTLGPEHPEVAASLHDLAVLYGKQGRYADAESLSERALSIWEKTLGPEHPDLTWSLITLAVLYDKQGLFAEAEPLFKRALEIKENALGPQHPAVASDLADYSRHRGKMGDTAASLTAARKAFEIMEASFREGSAVMPERDALKHSRLKSASANRFLSAYFDCPAHTETARTWAATVILSTKGQTSEAVLARATGMHMMALPGVTVDSLRAASSLLSNLYVSGPGDEGIEAYRETLDKTSRDKKRFETRLARTDTTYRRLQDILHVDAGKIADVLEDISSPVMLVEYMRYIREDVKSGIREPHYLVCVCDGAGPQGIIDLGRAEEIEDLVARYRAHILDIAFSRRGPDIHDQAEHSAVAERLYDLIWSPIETLVSVESLIAIAPEGALCLVPFAGLIDPDGSYLIEQYHLHYLSSGRDLLRLRHADRSGVGLLALGDPDYDSPAAMRQGPAADQPYPSLSEPVYVADRVLRSIREGLNALSASPLPGTRTEVELVSQKWETATREPLAVYFGSDASEQRLKAEAPGKRVIHLATHGYFLSGGTGEEPGDTHDLGVVPPYLEENPLLLTGLLLAGANLRGEGAASIGVEDGILTAEEVTTMTLSGTQLVVLSACETGLGKVEEGEGVYGLRRAFQIAGARTVISALWPVSDEATAYMMSELYGRHDEIIPETMRRIQLQKIKELRQSGQPDHPFTWGGFIAMGDWR